MPQVTLLKADAAPQIMADTLASDTLAQRQRSSAMVGRALAMLPDDPALVLDFARGGYARGGRGGINTIGALDELVTFTRSGTGTYWATDGLLRTAAVNAPRFSFDRLTGRAQGLLVEGAGTNILLHSTNLTNAPWTGLGDFTVTPATSVIEGQTAYRFANLGVFGFRAVTQVSGTLTGSPETVSVIVEKGTSETSVIGLRNLTASTWVYAVRVDFATLGVTLFGGAGQHRVTDLGVGPNGGRLLRVSLTGTGTADGSRAVSIYPSDTSVNTDASIIHHTQLEAGVGETSPIITTTAAVTRPTDSAILSGDPAALGFGDDYTLLAIGRPPRSSSTDGIASMMAVSSAGVNNERLLIAVRDFPPLEGDYRTYFQSFVGTPSAGASTESTPLVPASGQIKLALAGDAQATSGAFGGQIVWTNIGGARTHPVNRIDIGAFVSGNCKWGGTIEQLVIWPRRLTNTQLQEITA